MPFNVGPVELIIVLIIALLVIGPKRLPEMGNAVGKTIREFRKASTEVSEATTFGSETKPSAGSSSTPPNTSAPAAAAPSTASVAAGEPDGSASATGPESDDR